MTASKNRNTWQNRIVGMGEKPAKDFAFNPLNWRTHPEFQRMTLDAVLTEVGWVTGVIENITTGHLLDGHARIEQALAKNPDEMVPFIQVELSEEEERKILAVLDPISGLATADDEKFSALSEMLDFDSSALGDLMANREIAQINVDEFFRENLEDNSKFRFAIELEFDDAAEHERVLEKLNAIAKTPGAAVKQLLSL